MRVLVMGGTRFVGRYIVQAALDAGHRVTVFHRGRTGADLFPAAEHLTGDRDGDLTALHSGTWDATVDVNAYVPRQVRSLADALGSRAGRYVFVSTMSVYADDAPPEHAESAPRRTPPAPEVETVTAETYGGLKVACEAAATASFGTATVLVRPTYVIGPFDVTGRFTWWVLRIARGGEVAAPGPHEALIQLIDARDLAAFTVGCLAGSAAGPYSVVSPLPAFTFRDMLESVRAEVGPPGTTLTWLDPAFLAGGDPPGFPLWAGGELGRAADPARALAAGLRVRPLRGSVRDTFDHESVHPTAADRRLGPTAAEEADLLARWRAS